MPLRERSKAFPLKRRSLIGSVVAAIAVGAEAWIGYGNPFREIPSNGYDRNDYSQAFFILSCDRNGICKIDPKYKRVMHFSFGDGVMASPGDIQGQGWNPVAIARGLGLTFLPEANYPAAAVKWCTDGEIFAPIAFHGDAYLVPISNDPLKTARCVQDQVPRPFSVYIGDPMGIKRDRKIFAPLYPKEKTRTD